MLLGGHAVTPVDWWSEQWVQDRVLRKLREAERRRPPPPAPDALHRRLPAASGRR